MKDIIEMAREAGFVENRGNVYGGHQELERFAALVAAAEREACAKVCDDMESVSPEDDNPAPWRIAEAIRAGSNT